MGRGGKRPGAGRPKGSKNRITEALLEDLEESGRQTPLEFLMATMTDPGIEFRLRLDAAKAAAPYVHARQQSLEEDEAADRVVWLVSSEPLDAEEWQEKYGNTEH